MEAGHPLCLALLMVGGQGAAGVPPVPRFTGEGVGDCRGGQLCGGLSNLNLGRDLYSLRDPLGEKGLPKAGTSWGLGGHALRGSGDMTGMFVRALDWWLGGLG